MARNRKYQSAAIRFGPAVKAFLLCVLIGGSGVGYVWQKSQINELGQQIRKRELRLTELEEQNKKLKNQLAMMRSQQFLEVRIKELNLGLAAPQPSQVWPLKEPSPGPARPGNPGQTRTAAAAADFALSK
jgi:TolA-binding protein